MPVVLHEHADGKILILDLHGKLVREDYEHFTPRVESAVRQHGKVRMLVRMQDFHGWSIGAMWDDFTFGLKHFADIDRLAFVGEKRWEATMATLCKPFTAATVRYFDQTQASDAMTWISEGLLPSLTTEPGQVVDDVK